MIDKFLEWSFQQQANKLYKRRNDMSIDKVTPQEWDRLEKIKGVKYDSVHKPKHYNNGSIECISYIKQQLGSEFPSYLEGSAIKYIHRHRMKHNNNIEDLEKAKWYINKLIEHYENL